jgi:hypothetical protein
MPALNSSGLALGVLVVALADEHHADHVLEVAVVLDRAQAHPGASHGEVDLSQVVGGDAVPAREAVRVLNP